MPKHDELTQEEFAQYKPPSRAVDQIKQYAKNRGLPFDKVKVLDWGCGRGRFVLWLREQGFDAHGVDIDPEPINNGLILFETKGYHNKPLTLFSSEGRTVYEDGTFDFIMTDNVLEHVQDIDKVMVEIGRLTSAQGGGYHIFPAQRQFIEGHLFMPFVHWLPAGNLRRSLIRWCVKRGKDPKWTEVEGLNLEDKVDIYYKYSTDHIFYRPYRQIKARFEALGFKVKFLSIQNPAVAKHKLLGPLSRFALTRPLINWMVLTFKQVEVTLTRSN
jgi:ubiquinone/menaquinone biosynthesis C-methylase UbiE